METSLRIVGLDISPTALSLARHNQQTQMRLQSGVHHLSQESLAEIRFIKADVLQDTSTDLKASSSALEILRQLHGSAGAPLKFDILISNPPYVSSTDYWRTTARSVRDYEPKLAVVPTNFRQYSSAYDGDVFYPRLLDMAERVDAKVVLFEVADLAQANRVATMAVDRGIWQDIEIWRDQPDDASTGGQSVSIKDREVMILGSGNGRSIFLRRKD